MRSCLGTLVLIALCIATAPLLAEEFDEKFDHWPVDCKINGVIIVANRLADCTEVGTYFLEASGGEQAKIVVIALGEFDPNAFFPDADDSWDTTVINSAATDIQPEGAFATAELDAATGVMLLSDRTPTASERIALGGIRDQLHQVVRRGGVVLASNQLARLMSQVEITGGEQLAQVGDGLDLIPDSVIETRFSTAVDRRRVQSVLVSHPRTVAIGLEENTAVALDGRILRVLGDGRATVMVTANEYVPFRAQTIAKPTPRRQRPNDFLIDLTQWRRIAMERTLDPFPPAEPKTPNVDNGTLVIVGGGGMPKGLMQRFVDLAGGVEHARLVYVPCSEADQLEAPQGMVVQWEKMGAQHATFIHTKDRHKANEDKAFLAPLKDATGIWFGGGRQWNFADSYYGTTAHELMKKVLDRGGVIGGSSAGASIQASYLARATPISNVDLMAPGYERGGLGFIRGVAIDQHFSQRGRLKDMTQLVNHYPQLLGIGLDEATAIIVQKSQADVVGSGKAYFYDRRLPVYPDKPDYIALPAGSSYDLAERTVLESDTADEPGDRAASR